MKKTSKQIRAAQAAQAQPVKVPKCSTCHQPLVRCTCKHNKLSK